MLDRAVVLDCLHVFCVPCISRWAKLRRECPLCKGFFQAFIHDIVSAADFKERRLSPLRTQDSKDAAGSEDAIQVGSVQLQSLKCTEPLRQNGQTMLLQR